MNEHDATVSKISNAVAKFHAEKKPFRIYHGSTSSTRPSQYNKSNIVDTSTLTNVLNVDTVSKTCLIEPNVGMDGLLAATLPHGLVPPVVMEFPGITVGGGFSGTSGESSSFRHGFFEENVKNIEIVLGDGTIVKASETENSDLFLGAASSFGTLGVVTQLELHLVEAEKYIQLECWKADSAKAAVEKTRQCFEDKSIQYLDAIAFSKTNIIVCAGRMTSKPKSGVKIQTFSNRADPWFYLYIQKNTKRLPASSSEPFTVATPITDYLFRWDRGGFWTGRYAYKYFCMPFDRVGRYVMDRYMHTRVLYHAMHKSGLAKQYLVQDVGVPLCRIPQFLNWLDEEYSIYPLWLCPLRGLTDSSRVAGGGIIEGEEPWTMNVGIWGPGSSNRKKFVEENRRLEQKVDELGGKKCLYAHAYYTEEEFWRIYDKPKYDALRQKYNATFLPTIYDKTKVDIDAERLRSHATTKAKIRHGIGKIWPVRGIYGVYHAWKGGDYLLGKENQTKLQQTRIDKR